MQNLLTKIIPLLSAGFYYVIHSSIQSNLFSENITRIFYSLTLQK